MAQVTTLLERNGTFAEGFASGNLPIRPQMWVVVLTCLDARVDPAYFLQLGLGDAFVVRNAGGRVTPAVIEDLAVLSGLGAHMPSGAQPPLELVLIRHTNCGMARLAGPPVRQDVAERLGIADDEVAAMAVIDPAETVRADIEQLRQTERIPEGLVVSGLVYNVEDGSIDEVVPPEPLSHAT